MKQRQRKRQPVLEIDETSPFAWLRFIAGCVWAGDQRRINHALVTYSAEMMAALRDAAAQPAQPVTMMMLSHRLDILPAELARMPGAAAFYSSFLGQPHEASRSVERSVFEPAGHFRAVAEAPGVERIVLEYAKAVQGGAFHAGTLLSIIAMLACCHPEMPASLNRAIAVLRGLSGRGLMQLPSDRTLVASWKNWRHLAPVWAALIGNIQDASVASNLGSFGAGLETLQDPVRLSRLLGHAKWFRSFAVSFMPEHAAAPLIPSAEAVEIIARAPEREPPLASLPPAKLEAAQRYRAPTRKFFHQG